MAAFAEKVICLWVIAGTTTCGAAENTVRIIFLESANRMEETGRSRPSYSLVYEAP